MREPDRGELEKSVADLLAELPGLRVGVVGDFCLDVYLTIEPSAAEISVETGLATRPVARQRYSLGGAGNVCANLTALGAGRVEAFGVTGRDPYGGQMRRLLEQAGVAGEGLLEQPERWDTHTYTKLYVGHEEQPRLDFGNFNELAAETGRELLAALERRLARLDVLVVNQQVRQGIHTPSFRRELQALIARREPTCVVDSRSYSDEFRGVHHKINEREGAALLSTKTAQMPTLGQARGIGRRLFRRWGKPLFLTRGARGCLVIDEGGTHEVPGLLLLRRTDPVGAGDTMLAAIAAALGAGRSPLEAATFGNLAAGVTVQKLFQTGTASPAEVRALARDHGYRYHPELAASPQKARYYRDTTIEIVTPVRRHPPPVHVIFDHDGTISTLRRGWAEVMEATMVRAVLGDHQREADRHTRERVTAGVKEYIERTTGVQTLVQMQGLAEMVREAGLVPPARVLDENGYKEVYNRELMRLVEGRLERLRSGELGVKDFTLRNAVAFLQRLRERGATLYLASGTDQADVEREAGLLGYASLFCGGIYGARGDIRHEPKKQVLETILREVERRPRERFVTFGDGPVEIQETRKRGGTAVGVASDERRRRGLNPVKRRRLIEAGAQLVIPDFGPLDPLVELLFGSRG